MLQQYVTINQYNLLNEISVHEHTSIQALPGQMCKINFSYEFNMLPLTRKTTEFDDCCEFVDFIHFFGDAFILGIIIKKMTKQQKLLTLNNSLHLLKRYRRNDNS